MLSNSPDRNRDDPYKVDCRSRSGSRFHFGCLSYLVVQGTSPQQKCSFTFLFWPKGLKPISICSLFLKLNHGMGSGHIRYQIAWKYQKFCYFWRHPEKIEIKKSVNAFLIIFEAKIVSATFSRAQCGNAGVGKYKAKTKTLFWEFRFFPDI